MANNADAQPILKLVQMKILWITNILFPEAMSLITGENQLKASGGWMIGLANEIAKHPEIELSIATIYHKVKSLKVSKGENITYYTFPFCKGNLWYNKKHEKYWKEIYDMAKPDIVHIHGTEYSQGLAFMNVFPEAKVVISIQGLISVIQKHFCDGLSTSQILKNLTFRDIKKNNSLIREKKTFRRRGEEVEVKMLEKCKYIIGRTNWDHAHVKAVNPAAEYFFCNEILREEFYTGRWEYDRCQPHTIFLSQATSPFKGLHKVLEALPAVLRRYPDAKVRIAGANITRFATFRDKTHLTGYGRIIRGMLAKNNLWKHVEFTGPLNAREMKEAFLSSNVFVCPSSIENSPNSLGEAQLLGVPCVASYVGGTPLMVPDESCGLLYNFDEHEILAQFIMEQFEKSKDFDNTAMRTIAHARHNREQNTARQIEIYKEIFAR